MYPATSVVLMGELEHVAHHCIEGVDLRGVEQGVQSSDGHRQFAFLAAPT
jgi:hypothetical protein